MSEYRGIDLIQGFDRKAWTRRNGWAIGRPFRGSQTKIEQAMLAAIVAGDAFEMTPGEDGAPWEIVIFFGSEETQATNEPLSDEWERLQNDLEKKLWILPFVRDGLIAIRDNAISLFGQDDGHDYLQWIKKTIDLYCQGENQRTQPDYKTLAGDEFKITIKNIVENLTQVGVSDTAAFDWVSRISRLYARGVESFPVSTFALRRTRIVAANFDFNNLSDLDTDLLKIRSTSSLINAHPVPARFQKIIPTEGEWLKKVATVSMRGQLKDQVIEEWWHADSWEREIYGEPL